MISRRKALIGSAAAIATVALATPHIAIAGWSLTPHPSRDDWAQITAAFANLRSAGRGWVEFEQLSSSTPFNLKQCVNGTLLTQADIRFAPGTMFRCDGFTGPTNAGRVAPMFDFSSGYWMGVTGQGNIAGLINGLDGSSPVGTLKPGAALLFANGDTKRVVNMATSGKFGSAAVAFVACTDIDVIDGGLGNYDETAPVLTLSSTPDWGLWSPYTTFNNMGFVADAYIRTRIHGLGRQSWSTYLRNAQNVRFEHCLMDNNGRAHVLAQASNDSVVVTGGKAYSEFASSNPIGIFESGAGDACTNLKIVGFQAGGKPVTIGAGNFSGLQVI